MENRISVAQVAKLMQVSEQFVRIGLIQGKFPWGYAVKMSSVWTYYISPQMLTKYTGINPQQKEVKNDGKKPM